MEWLLGFSLRDQALESAPALAVCPLLASRRPVRTQLGALNSRVSGPLFLQPCTRPSCGPHRSLTVVPLISDKRYYGETLVGLWSGRAVGDATAPIPPKTAKNRSGGFLSWDQGGPGRWPGTRRTKRGRPRTCVYNAVRGVHYSRSRLPWSGPLRSLAEQAQQVHIRSDDRAMSLHIDRVVPEGITCSYETAGRRDLRRSINGRLVV